MEMHVPPANPDRYHRQRLLGFIGDVGQQRLGESRVVLVGCGALGCMMADQLVRAGVGLLRIIDRDIVDLTNLQRQILFDESDAREALPKAIAAARRLRQINSQVRIEAEVADFHAGNAEEIVWEGSGFRVQGSVEDDEARSPNSEGMTNDEAGGRGRATERRSDGATEGAIENRKSKIENAPCLILDGTDNVETRYLINDLAVKYGIPWIYGACVGSEGRVMAIVPGRTACLRCVFPQPPRPEELPTCDTAGVLAAAPAVVGAIQAAAAIRLLTGDATGAGRLLSFDLWTGRFWEISAARRDDCPCCGRRRFEFLEVREPRAVSLCGRNAVQLRRVADPGGTGALVERLSRVGLVDERPYFIRFRPDTERDLMITSFPDGRVVVYGTSDAGRARSVVAKYYGS